MSELSSKKRFAGFDILKFFCAFLIVVIHFPFPSVFGQLVGALIRIGVPIFFMITGYFYDETVRRHREKQQIIKILKLTVAANIGYFLFNLAGHILKKDVGAYLAESFSPVSIFNFLVLNDSPFGNHLWYLGALLYVLIIAALLTKIKRLRLLIYAAPVLIVVELILGRYSALFFGSPLNLLITRNFLFTGIPFFAIGMFIKRLSVPKNPAPFFAASAVFYLLSVFEYYLPSIANFEAVREHYLNSTLLSVSVFMIFYIVYQNRSISKAELLMASIGQKYSAWIYILHPAVGQIMNSAFKKLGIFPVYSWIAPVAVFCATTALSVIVLKLTKLAGKKTRSRK